MALTVYEICLLNNRVFWELRYIHSHERWRCCGSSRISLQLSCHPVRKNSHFNWKTGSLKWGCCKYAWTTFLRVLLELCLTSMRYRWCFAVRSSCFREGHKRTRLEACRSAGSGHVMLHVSLRPLKQGLSSPVAPSKDYWAAVITLICSIKPHIPEGLTLSHLGWWCVHVPLPLRLGTLTPRINIDCTFELLSWV